MKRIFETTGSPEQGAVYRDLATTDCLSFDPLDPVTPPGCFSFITTDNTWGALPTRYAGNTDIDPFAYNNKFTSHLDIAPDSAFTDLWGNYPANLQTDIRIIGCYCPGEGVNRDVLTQGRPRFPAVDPLPFFWVPTPAAPTSPSGSTIIIPGDVPSVEETCPCDLSQEPLSWEFEVVGDVVTVNLNGKIKIPYTNYTGPFACCFDGITPVGTLTMQAGHIYVDELDLLVPELPDVEKTVPVIPASHAGRYVYLTFVWRWPDFDNPEGQLLIGDVKLQVETGGTPTAPAVRAYRTDSQGTGISTFEIMLGRLAPLANGDLCFEQYQRGPIELEGVFPSFDVASCPFELSIDPSNPDTAVIGRLRGNSDYYFKDQIQLGKSQLFKTASEDLMLTNDAEIYYEITMDGAGVITATAMSAAVGAIPTPTDGTLYWPIGRAEWNIPAGEIGAVANYWKSDIIVPGRLY